MQYGGLCVCGQPVGHGGECRSPLVEPKAPHWRTDTTRLGRILYRDDVCVGMLDTPELAAEVVAALNAYTRRTKFAAMALEADGLLETTILAGDPSVTTSR